MTPLTNSIRVRDTGLRVVSLTLAAMVALMGCSASPESSPSSPTTAATTMSSPPATALSTIDLIVQSATTTSEPETTTTMTEAAIAWTPPEVCRSSQCDTYESLAVLPVVFTGRDSDIGGDGVTYFRHDVPLWGPAGLIIDPAGDYWIIDSQAHDGPRLIRVDQGGNGFELVDIEGAWVVSILDAAPVAEGIAMLNAAGETGTYIEIVDHRGTVTNHILLPEQDFGPASGMSGLAATPDGQLLVEMEGGARTATVDPTTGDYMFHSGYHTAAGSYRFAYPLPGATETTLHAPYANIPIAAPDSLGSLGVIGVNPDASFVISVDWMSFANSEIVDGGRQLLWYNADGTLQGTAEFPISQQEIHIEHPVYLAPNGYLYGLLTRSDHVEIVRFAYQPPKQ